MRLANATLEGFGQNERKIIIARSDIITVMSWNTRSIRRRLSK